MCSICGIFDPEGLGLGACAALMEMRRVLSHRGPDASGEYVTGGVALGHNRLAVVDLAGGGQPMTVEWRGRRYTVVYNGELYNTGEVQQALAREGYKTKTHSDTEAVVAAYAVWGTACVERFNGIYAFSVYDEGEECLFCARDRMGVKPFFFAQVDGAFVFAPEVKALLKYPGVRPVLDARGLWELLYLSPVTLPGRGVFRDIRSLMPGEWCRVTGAGVERHLYWSLSARKHSHSRDETVAYVRHLLEDAIGRQLVSDVPLCCFLSGGLDSSVVSAVAARRYAEEGRVLDTYSFEYEDNEYAPTLFQPNPDDAYAVYMAEQIGSHHTRLIATSEAVAAELDGATLSRDFPGQADIDSSLRYYCGRVKERHTVALSGECADEIFGGYPWFYRPEMLSRRFFPWLHDPMARVGLFREECVRPKEGFAWLSEEYTRAVAATPVLEGEEAQDRTARIATKLSVDYFMASLLERKDRMSMAHGLEVRVPFSDHRILEYVYNVPWRVKHEGGVEKALLRNAMAPYLPDRILHRKKSPYPKTHSADYERRVQGMLLSRLARPDSPLSELLRPTAVRELAEGGDVTWLGQLMSRPQMYAWLYQLDLFLSRYGVELSL
ncbi:MAG: asparagine synthase (glutamine-hydrolyzing) [Clostridia bacterium]|nr:asparagine synthase (glutamine-hydrolyzing) [Clostridia bacterium]